MEVMKSNEDLELLMQFLSMSPASSAPVLAQFTKLDGAVVHLDGEKRNFVYVPGSREDRVLLVAHADTVWDSYYIENAQDEETFALVNKMSTAEHRLVMEDGIIIQGGWSGWGIGADDRAGCAMLWLLKVSGHSLLITDGEEHGQIGANHLMNHYPHLAEEINDHQYMIQLDRRGRSDYKTYRLPVTEEFRHYIKEQTGFEDAGNVSLTDIVTLCRRICGVNLSIGYYDEHTPMEYLDYYEWLYTLNLVRSILQKKQPEFLLQGLI